MGWFCDEIIAQPSPALVEYLSQNKKLARRLYHVHEIPFERHGFPADGLLFLRKVGHPEAPNVKISWDDFPDRSGSPLLIDPSAPKVFSLEDEEFSPSPPARFLHFLKSLAEEFKIVVAYYSASSWGGALENEYAWVFTPVEVVYCSTNPSERRICIYGSDGSISPAHGDVLAKTLLHFGIDSPSGFFTPHTSDFAWRIFRINKRA